MTDKWTLLTSHGHVLFFVAAEPDATVRKITDAIGISERRVSSILHDLEEAGMIRSTRVGTRKHYEVNPDAHFRHPTLSHVMLRDVLGQIQARDTSPPTVRWRR
ncbi:MAG: helix-turn-helix transcriptional regulator [Chloroflexi bacterium]|nr:helix-turn-helix transcriptional regulator [Chloroflexota bacterium]